MCVTFFLELKLAWAFTTSFTLIPCSRCLAPFLPEENSKFISLCGMLIGAELNAELAKRTKAFRAKVPRRRTPKEKRR